ncbi:hypothetical protein D3C77_699470 [compost metagenome]
MRAPLGEQGNRLLAILGSEHLVPLLAYDGGEQQAIGRAIFGDQYAERLDISTDLVQLMSNNLSKLEIARILRTSELALTTRTSDSSPPA